MVVIALHRFGITPTYMGNTELLAQNADCLGDHPHIHGEYVS